MATIAGGGGGAAPSEDQKKRDKAKAAAAKAKAAAAKASAQNPIKAGTANGKPSVGIPLDRQKHPTGWKSIRAEDAPGGGKPMLPMPKNMKAAMADAKKSPPSKNRVLGPVIDQANIIRWMAEVGFEGVWNANYEQRAKSLKANKDEIMSVWRKLKKLGGL